MLDHFTGIDPEYRGRESKADVTLAMSFAGHMNIELIQPNNRDAVGVSRVDRSMWIWIPSLGACHLRDSTGGEALRAAGHELAFLASVPTGGRVAYMDTTSEMPGYVELIELGGGFEPAVQQVLPRQHRLGRA